MSVIRIAPGNYDNPDALERVFNYCLKNIYDGNGCKYWDGAGISSDSIKSAIFDMRMVKFCHNKMDGKQLHQFVLSLKRKQLEDVCYYNSYYKKYDKRKDQPYAMTISLETSELVYNMGFQNAFFIHDDTDYVHIHFILNSVNYKTGIKIYNLTSIVNSVYYHLNREFKFLDWKGVMYY